ncbi:MAG: hypothetical protein AB7N65_18755 [Vicinamibacterales bacterium]
MSLRALAQCIGAVTSQGEFSVARQFFGHEWRPRPMSEQGLTRAGLQISLRAQTALLRGPHVHLNLIRVGFEFFETEDLRHLDRALATVRSVFAAVGIGIGRVRPYFIPDAQAAEVGVVSSWIAFDDQAAELTDMFKVDNDALDVFLVLDWGLFSSQPIGRSAVDGPCDKELDACEMSGLVVSVSRTPTTTGFTLAHELGHYLGLSHIGDLSVDDLDQDDSGVVEEDEHAMFPMANQNLMYPVIRGSNLTSGQGTTMREHCFVKSGCQGGGP